MMDSYLTDNKNDNFIKTKFKKSNDLTNIHKYRVAANITEYYIKIKLPQNQYSKNLEEKAIISCKFTKINMVKMNVWTF